MKGSSHCEGREATRSNPPTCRRRMPHPWLEGQLIHDAYPGRMGSRSRPFAVYILTNKHHTVLYTGVTNNLQRRMVEHRRGSRPAFTHRYHAHKLVYFERFGAPRLAIAREKQIKAGPRSRKVALIESVNPGWRVLSEDW